MVNDTPQDISDISLDAQPMGAGTSSGNSLKPPPTIRTNVGGVSRRELRDLKTDSAAPRNRPVSPRTDLSPPEVRIEEDPDAIISRLFPSTPMPRTARLVQVEPNPDAIVTPPVMTGQLRMAEEMADPSTLEEQPIVIRDPAYVGTVTDPLNGQEAVVPSAFEDSQLSPKARVTSSSVTDRLGVPDEASVSSGPAEQLLPALSEEMERDAQASPATGQGARRSLMHGILVVGHLLFLNTISIPVSAYIFHQLGALGLGQWSAATTLVTICGFLTSLGLRPIFIRRVSQSPETAQQDLADQLGLRLCLTVASAVLAIGYTYAVGYPWVVKQCTILAVAALALNVGANVFADALQGLHRMKTFSAVNFVQGGALTVVSVFVAYRFGDPITMSLAYLTGPILFFALLGLTIQTEHFPIRMSLNFRRYGELLKESSKVGIYQLSIALRDRLEHLLLPKLTGLTSFGYYFAGTMAADRLFIVPEGFVTAFYPTIAKAHTEEPTQVEPHIAQLLITTLVACAPLVILVRLLAQPIAEILFRKDPELCRTIISITIWAVVLKGIQQPMGCALQATGRHDVAARNGVYATIVSLIVTIYLLFNFKMVGAYWSWPVRAGISVVFLIAPFQKFFPGVWKQVPLFRIGLSVAIMMLAIYGAEQLFTRPVYSYAVGTIVGILGYFISLVVLRVVRFADLKLLLKRH